MNERDEILSALLDDELDDEIRLDVQALLRENPGNQARLAAFSEVDNLLRQAYGEINDTPLPAVDPDALYRKPPIAQRQLSVPLAAAAGIIMLLTGALVGMVTERLTFTAPNALVAESTQPDASAAAIETDLRLALETFKSGAQMSYTLASSSETTSIVITRTWKLEDGRFCREYDLAPSQNQSREIGVACREQDGTWRVRMRMWPDDKGTFL